MSVHVVNMLRPQPYHDQSDKRLSFLVSESSIFHLIQQPLKDGLGGVSSPAGLCTQESRSQ